MGSHPLYRHTCFLLCCHDDAAYNKKKDTALFLWTISCVCLTHRHMETITGKSTLPSTCTGKEKMTHTHTLALPLFSYKYSCTKTAAQITLLQHKRPSSYGFIWSVKPCWHASRVNLLENRSLYWDIHQSHHCGLPDAATAHQDIRYWKLTRGFGDNKNVYHGESNVTRSETAAFDATCSV